MSLPGKQEVRITRYNERYRHNSTSQTGILPILVRTVVTLLDKHEALNLRLTLLNGTNSYYPPMPIQSS